MSFKYIVSESVIGSSIAKASEGAVGINIHQFFSNVSVKSFCSSLPTFCAFK
ncbi:MAG: hypothetical protein MRQ13_05925 [Candidatus Midichloria sp.]|nr:hypothetical protein [Candidatus Midichloria sp.]